MAIKFTETVIVAQSIRTEFSETIGYEDLVNLSMISRDHRFLSYRKLDNEAIQSFNMLLDHLSSSTITSQTLLSALLALCNVARQRPNYMLQVIVTIKKLELKANFRLLVL
jgi:hypothetical protein